MTYIDRELAEALWLETWEEMQLDDEMMRLWEEGQARDRAINDEVLVLVEAGQTEIPF